MIVWQGLLFLDENVTAPVGGPLTGTISTDELVTSSISVPAQGILTISAGVTLTIDNYYDFKVFGTLRCLGTALDPVRIIYSSSPPGPGKWSGIFIDGGSAIFNYTIIESASYAIHVKSSTSVEINYCILRKSTVGVLAESNSMATIFNTSIQDCSDRDIHLKSNSQIEMDKSILSQTGGGTTLPALELNTGSKINVINSTIEDKYRFNADLSGGSEALFSNCNMSYSSSKYRHVDSSSKTLIKNFIHINGGTKTESGIDHFENAEVNIFDDTNRIYTKYTDKNGSVQWLEVIYMTITSTGPVIHNISIEMDYEFIFNAWRYSINMSKTHWEYFINELPQFLFDDIYHIPEDTCSEKFLDLFNFVKDDYFQGDSLYIKVIENTGANLGGKKIAFVDIISGRWLKVDLLKGDDNDNWSGEFKIRFNAFDELGSRSGYVNESDYVTINVTPVNDPPAWNFNGNIELIEDVDYIDEFDARDYVYDSDSKDFQISFAVKDYDISNFAASIPAGQLQIKILNRNYTGTSNITLCAFDGENWGNYSTKIVITPTNDPPAINNSLDDFSMFEETIDTTSVNLYDVFVDSDNTTLEFSANGNKFIEVSIDSITGFVTFKPKKDWYGVETIEFHANDSKYMITDSVVVSVENVNDPPEAPTIILPSSRFEFKLGETITFSAHAYDRDIDNPDLPEGGSEDSLSYIWTVNTTKIPISLENNFTYSSLPEGRHKITVTVIDSAGSKNQTDIDLVIFGIFTLPRVTHLSPLPDFWTITSDIRLEWEVDADVESLPFISYTILLYEENMPQTILVEGVKYTSHTVKLPRERTTYYWTVIPYIGPDKGINASGTWYLYYEYVSPPPIYSHSVIVQPSGISLYPGDSGKIEISVKNTGDIPDRYTVTILTEKIITNFFDRTMFYINGSGDGNFGLSSKETENVLLTITIPENFQMYGDYQLEIIVESLNKDNDETFLFNLTIFEKPDDKKIIDDISGSSLWKIILGAIISIIIAIILLLLFFQFRTGPDDDEKDEVEEVNENGDTQLSTDAISPSTLQEKAQSDGEIEIKKENFEKDQKNVTCGNCGNEIIVESQVRPVTINCTGCGNSFLLK